MRDLNDFKAQTKRQLLMLTAVAIGGALLTTALIMTITPREVIRESFSEFDRALGFYTATPAPLPTTALPPSTTRFVDHEAGVVCYQNGHALSCVTLTLDSKEAK